MKRHVVVASAATLLAAAASAPALGGPTHPTGSTHPAGQFPSTITPNKGVTPGTTLTLKSTKAKKKTQYTCVFIVFKKGSTNYGAYTGSLKTVKSNRHGHVSCTQTYQPYTTNYGKTLHCPPKKKERKAGYHCGIALSNSNQTSVSAAAFSAKR